MSVDIFESGYYPIPFLNIENYNFDVETVKLIPEEIARAHSIVALEKLNGVKTNILITASSNPKNKIILDILERKTGCIIREFEADFNSITNVINETYNKTINQEVVYAG